MKQTETAARSHAEQVQANQQRLRSGLKPCYDFIVCGSGSSGSVVARRLAESPDVDVLLIEAGGSDDVASVMEANQWPLNLGSERDWGFTGQPNPHVNGRAIPLSMGKVLGGGSSINVMAWARGHKSDWDFFAAEAGDPAWSHESILSLYRRIEDWHGAPDPQYRGVGGLVFVQPAPDPNPIAPAMLEGARSIGSKAQRLGARSEVVLSMGAMHTPKVLMLSGIGDEAELRRLGIPLVQHLPGVGQNFQDHFAMGCVWEYQQALPPRNNGGEATYFWKSHSSLESPDLHISQVEVPLCSRETAARFSPPAHSWSLYGGVVRPQSRGRIRLTGPDVHDPIEIEANTLSHPDDLRAAIACVEICREVGNSLPLRPYTKREVMPGNLKGAALEAFIRDAASTYHHQTCTAKMGRDAMSVVDAQLRVYGVDNLRIADGSIMPRVTTGYTMAPCVAIGERAGEMLRASHRI